MPRPSDPHARARLLDAARAVFSERGLDRSKVEDITTRAQLSKGAFYLHFESKEEAFRELLSSVMTHLEQQVTPAGVHVTSCAIVIAPDESLERLVDGVAPDACCLICAQHADGAAMETR